MLCQLNTPQDITYFLSLLRGNWLPIPRPTVFSGVLMRFEGEVSSTWDPMLSRMVPCWLITCGGATYDVLIGPIHGPIHAR